eukprot:6699159-Lingulodinium_polyedra.AAC.1
MVVALGAVEFVALLVWPVELVSAGKEGPASFALQSSVAPANLQWLCLLDWGTWEVLPCTPVSPARAFVEA